MLGTDDTAAENADTSLLYAGEQYDSDLDQYYLRARYYNPWSGTFNRTDPFAGNNSDPQSLHKYLYCHNNPINAIDPSGEMSLPLFIAIALTITLFVVGASYVATHIYHQAISRAPTPGEKMAVELAIKNAKTLANKSLTRLRYMTKTAKLLYRTWFGTYDSSMHQKVKEHFRKIKEYLYRGFEWRVYTDYKRYGSCVRRLDLVLFSNPLFFFGLSNVYYTLSQ